MVQANNLRSCSRMCCSQLLLMRLLFGVVFWESLLTEHRLSGWGVCSKWLQFEWYVPTRTTSCDAALLLTQLPSVQFIAVERERIYTRIRWIQKETGPITRAIKAEEKKVTMQQWRKSLVRENIYGSRTRDPIISNFYEWLNRPIGGVGWPRFLWAMSHSGPTSSESRELIVQSICIVRMVWQILWNTLWWSALHERMNLQS